MRYCRIYVVKHLPSNRRASSLVVAQLFSNEDPTLKLTAEPKQQLKPWSQVQDGAKKTVSLKVAKYFSR